MSRRGLIIGAVAYLVVFLIYIALKGGRGGDMPFGYGIFVWPVLMFPLGLIGMLSPAFYASLSSSGNEVFGTYDALKWFAYAGNFLLWSLAGGLIGRIRRRQR